MKKTRLSSDVGFVSAPGSSETLRELWQARHLIGQVMWRDMTVRYRHTWIGWLWAVINPALNMALYYGVFGLMVRFRPPEYHAPYALVLLSGLVIWMLFAATLNATSECLLNNLHLIKKIWFPRSALTLAACGVSLLDFILGLLCLGVLLPLCGIFWPLWQLPLLMLCGFLMALAGWGIGCILAILRLRYRDIRHLMPLLVQGIFYVTPVVWTPGLLPVRWQWLETLNPLAGIIALFRYALLRGPMPAPTALLIAVTASPLLAVVGYRLFVRYEPEATEKE